MRQTEAYQEAQRGERGGKHERSPGNRSDIEEEPDRRGACGDPEARGCGLLAELPTLCGPGLGRGPVARMICIGFGDVTDPSVSRNRIQAHHDLDAV